MYCLLVRPYSLSFLHPACACILPLGGHTLEGWNTKADIELGWIVVGVVEEFSLFMIVQDGVRLRSSRFEFGIELFLLRIVLRALPQTPLASTRNLIARCREKVVLG